MLINKLFYKLCMVTLEVGCLHCSAKNFVTSPDPSYTKVSTTAKFGAKSSTYRCITFSCGKENKIYWEKD